MRINLKSIKNLVHKQDSEKLKELGFNLKLCLYCDSYESIGWDTYITRNNEKRNHYLYNDKDNGHLYFPENIKQEFKDETLFEFGYQVVFYLQKGDFNIFFNRNCNKYYRFIEDFIDSYQLFDINDNYCEYDKYVAVRWLGAYQTGVGSSKNLEDSLRYETSLKDREVSAQAIYCDEESSWSENLERKSLSLVENDIYSTLERCRIGVLYFQPEIRLIYREDAYTRQIGSVLTSVLSSHYVCGDNQETAWEESFAYDIKYYEAVLYKEAYPAAIVVRDRLLPENWEVVKKIAEEKGLPIYHVKGKSFFKKHLGIED